MNLVQPILEGNILALSHLLSQIENDTQEGQTFLQKLYSHTGNAQIIGVTGAPGTGKSSLVNQLTYLYRHPADGSDAKKVAIIAVDPSSPFSGGALLGDRIRMKALSGDPGVFIRSMASRGSLGGLAHATAGLVQAFDAARYPLIIIETVGAGQAEVDIARLVHTTVVVEAPGLGDDIQATKAGILEIADILVVNKADRPGAENTERALRSMLTLAHPVRRVFQYHGRSEHNPVVEENSEETAIWIPPVLRTIALEGIGVPELLQAISEHQAHLKDSGDLKFREQARIELELKFRIQDTLVSGWRASLPDAAYDKVLKKLMTREISPHEAAQTLINGSLK